MSLDILVWLPCPVSLDQDLPRQAEWKHSKITAESMPGLPKEISAIFQGHESWQIDRDRYLIRASRADGVEGLEAALSEAPNELADKLRASRMAVSLVLEGSAEFGYVEQAEVAEHLAKKCGGAVVSGPAGYCEIDEHGEWRA